MSAPEGEAIALDYAATGLTLRRHTLALVRSRLAQRGWRSADQLAQLRDGTSAWSCGIVTMRRQPETAKGVIFVTLEDETGSVNVIVWRHIRERQRTALLRSRLLAVAGHWHQGRQHPSDRPAPGGHDAAAGRTGHALAGPSLRAPPAHASESQRRLAWKVLHC